MEMKPNKTYSVQTEIILNLEYLTNALSLKNAENNSEMFLYKLKKLISEYCKSNKIVTVIKQDFTQRQCSVQSAVKYGAFKKEVEEIIKHFYSLTSDYKEIISWLTKHYEYQVLETAKDQWTALLGREPLICTPRDKEIWDQPVVIKIIQGEMSCVVYVGADNKVKISDK